MKCEKVLYLSQVLRLVKKAAYGREAKNEDENHRVNTRMTMRDSVFRE